MWSEQFKDKAGKTKYRLYKKYKDSYTDKWRRVCVVMNKDTKISQKESLFQLDDRIKNKITDNHNNKLEELTIHNLLDQWFTYHKNRPGFKEKYRWIYTSFKARCKTRPKTNQYII